MAPMVCLKEIYEDETVLCRCPVCSGLQPTVRAFALGLALLVAALALSLLANCGPTPRPQPPPRPPFNEVAAAATCAQIWQTELERAIDPVGLAGCVRDLRAGASVAQITANVRASDEWKRVHAPKPPPATTPVLYADGHVFRSVGGQAWRLKGVSAFKLLDRFAKGEDVGPFLEAYRSLTPAGPCNDASGCRYNTLRVWPYVNWHDPAGNFIGWEPPSSATARAFLQRVARDGWTVEFTLLTDDKPARLAWAKGFAAELAAAPRPTNLLLEGGNEPRTHKAIDTAGLRQALESSGFLFASGDYEDPARVFGTYLTHHSSRDAQWPRKAHDCLDWWSGAGPGKRGPPQRKPCVLDEPAKLQDVGGDHVNDWRAYFGAASIMAAGGTFHSEPGKFAQLPTAAERALATAALEGLNAFPADAPLGAYSRPVEASLRTYVVGAYMVRVRPTSDAPGSGWARIGSSRSLWRRVP